MSLDLTRLSTAADAEIHRRQAEDEHFRNLDIVDYGQANFFIESTTAPIVLLPHQQAILRYPFRRLREIRESLPFPPSQFVWATSLLLRCC